MYFKYLAKVRLYRQIKAPGCKALWSHLDWNFQVDAEGDNAKECLEDAYVDAREWVQAQFPGWHIESMDLFKKKEIK